MNRITILPDDVKKKIAAGEVVEGPSSVVKELVENSMDAGSGIIEVQVSEGGLKRISVRDDGCGIAAGDIGLAIAEHATSKILDVRDIEGISTFGFRGEALSSISSISSITILSRVASEPSGARLHSAGGAVTAGDYAGPAGTTVIVENLFYNTPARKKFMKSARSELRLIREAVLKCAVSAPPVSFSLDVDGKRQFTLPAAGSREERIRQVYGKEMFDSLYYEEIEDIKVRVGGFLSRPDSLRSSRSMQILFVNGRPVEYRYLGFILSRAYEPAAGKGNYPAGIIFIEIDPSLVDVNIHPAKREVKLFDQRYIDSLIYALADKALGRGHVIEVGSGARAVPATETDEAPAFDFGADGPAVITAAASPVMEIAEAYRIPERPADELGILGVAFGTYIVAEVGEYLFLVDFHAAHERMIYDRLMSSRDGYEVQKLIFPKILELTIEEHGLAMDNMAEFLKIGFDIEDFSDNSIKISAVPDVASKTDPEDIIRDVLGSAAGEGAGKGLREKIAASVSCRSARKAGDRLDREEMATIMKYIRGNEGRLRCPHGRPFVYKIEKNELGRMFKRQ
ncbi:MAG: DNA mismatch repair endonuclease MutL [Spirochaetes bacterium]|nr:DNA mismatch repair endonuclease MutL [Spirochaetota bacterium]